MDVELQILKHLKRDAQPTVAIIDRYCAAYNDIFPEVRSYECFKYLHQGIVSPIKRKSLPEIAKLAFKVFKPKGTLKESDTYKTKIELASSIVTELVEFGFKIELVLADSLYGEASSFIRTLE